MIKITNLVKRYGSLIALDHFNLEIAKGEVFGLLGPNGSGKTTAINCMLSLLKYDKGEIMLFGEKMSPKRFDIKQRIGIVPQNVAVFEELTVTENIDYFCGLYIKDRAERKRLVEEAIEFTALGDYKKFLPGKLSGGLLRRLNIACGIAHKPELIFFDEPTVAVDPQSRNSILKGITRLNQNGSTIVYTSHYMEEVEQICTNIMIMDKGKSIAQGKPEELKKLVQAGEKLSFEIYYLPDETLAAIRSMQGVNDADYHDNCLTVHCQNDRHMLFNVLEILKKDNVAVGSVYSEPPTFNDVFLEITGKQLRD